MKNKRKKNGNKILLLHPWYKAFKKMEWNMVKYNQLIFLFETSKTIFTQPWLCTLWSLRTEDERAKQMPPPDVHRKT